MGEKRQRVLGVPYWFRPGKGWYADFRSYGDVGGKRCKVGDTEAEAHEGIAGVRTRLIAARERAHSLDGGDPALLDLARDHLRKKRGPADAPNVAPKTLKGADRSIRHLIDYLKNSLGRDPYASDVTPLALSGFIEWRLSQPGTRGGKIRPGTVTVDLAHVSSLCATAVAYGCMATNPVSRTPNKPKASSQEPSWLERGEAWRVMEAARELPADPQSRCYPFIYPLVATMLLTGGRSGEVRGLLKRDVDFEAGRVRVRPNRLRKLKRTHHKRSVPIWPQLWEILEPHIEALPGDLLFPATLGGGSCIDDVRASLTTILDEDHAAIEKRVTPHTFRHTYCAARLQTTDNGAPVSPYTVMKELGHKNLQQIIDRYGHLLESRHRSPVVSYGEATVTPIRRILEE